MNPPSPRTSGVRGLQCSLRTLMIFSLLISVLSGLYGPRVAMLAVDWWIYRSEARALQRIRYIESQFVTFSGGVIRGENHPNTHSLQADPANGNCDSGATSHHRFVEACQKVEAEFGTFFANLEQNDPLWGMPLISLPTPDYWQQITERRDVEVKNSGAILTENARR